MTAPASSTANTLDVAAVREAFPILHRCVHDKPLVYLDNAATTQKPLVVLDTIDRYYRETNANVHRGVHYLSEAATEAYEGSRVRIGQYINAAGYEEIIYVRGTTEGINLVAQSWGRTNLGAGDEVLITYMEHHSNIVPWQIVCEQTGATLKVAPINDRGELIWEEFEKLLTERTKFVSVVHISNALGTINPVKQIVDAAHAVGAKVMIDAAQAAPHMPVDVRALDCDFLAFSAHKMYGPTGFGVLYGKQDLLEAMPPYQAGGDMIKSVRFEKTIYGDLPYKFEAGTPHIVGPIGLAAAMDYVESIGLDQIAAHEQDLLSYATQRLGEVDGLRLIGTAEHKASVLSFVLDFAHPLDAGTIMDRMGVAVRTGHHCAEPVMERFGVPATIRASLAFYNTREEIEALVRSIEKVRQFV